MIYRGRESAGFGSRLESPGAAAPGLAVTVYVDGAAAGTATADPSGYFRFATAALRAGRHTVYAEAGSKEALGRSGTLTFDVG